MRAETAEVAAGYLLVAGFLAIGVLGVVTAAVALITPPIVPAAGDTGIPVGPGGLPEENVIPVGPLIPPEVAFWEGLLHGAIGYTALLLLLRVGLRYRGAQG